MTENTFIRLFQSKRALSESHVIKETLQLHGPTTLTEMLHFSLEGQIPSAATAALPAVRVTTGGRGLSHTRKEQATDEKWRCPSG